MVVRALSPHGQVQLDGEIWEARAGENVPPGAEVTITAVDGLVLDVTPSTHT